MPTTTVIVIAVVVFVVGAVVGWVIQRQLERRDGSADEKAQEIIESARNAADATKRSAELEAKEMVLRARSEAEQEGHKRRSVLEAEKKRLMERDEALDRQSEQLDRRAREMDGKDNEVAQREGAAEAKARAAQEMLEKAERRLEALAQLTAEEAKAQLVERLQDSAREEAAGEIRRIEEDTERQAKDRATQIIAEAIQRYASDYVGERTVSVVQLPGDEMKGRIIGREGRNIRALEAATGVDLIIDDTPEAVILSCFDPVRREVARITLSRLLADGRIHPTRIEEVVKRAAEEVEAGCKESGEQAVFDLGLHRVHPALVALLGQLKFRSSHAQNLLQHSVEVGYVAGLMAAELGINVKQARRAGLFHDIGKAVAHEVEGTHAAIGANLASKYNESQKVVHAIAAHHGEVEPTTVLANLVDAANQLSARRPGARQQRLQSYIERLRDLEALCRKYAGVEKAFAIQAGREVRIMVQQDKIDDNMAVLLSKDIAKQVEAEMTYAGQIKVCVIRESRASDVAR